MQGGRRCINIEARATLSPAPLNPHMLHVDFDHRHHVRLLNITLAHIRSENRTMLQTQGL
jgi:hypothetical protein